MKIAIRKRFSDKAVINYHHDKYGWVVLSFTCLGDAFAHAGLLQHQYPGELFTLVILNKRRQDWKNQKNGL